jgi:hypothetical protein
LQKGSTRLAEIQKTGMLFQERYPSQHYIIVVDVDVAVDVAVALRGN